MFTDPASIMDLLDQMEPQGSPGQCHSMTEKMAINAIQKSLMQCETVVKSPTYTVRESELYNLYFKGAASENDQAAHQSNMLFYFFNCTVSVYYCIVL